MSEIIKRLEAREKKYRKQIGNAKKAGDEMSEKYLQGHVHEIESLLFILKEA
jgi:DNA-binding ferritin-like protein